MAHQLERIEWVQYWAEDCTEDVPRILMIGDSISVGYRSAVFARVRGTYGCATVSTSKAIDNPRFCAEIDALASSEGFEYPVIHFNNGLHGFQLTDGEYREHYGKVVDFLRVRWPGARLILAASTPVIGDMDARVTARNRIVKELADERGLEYNDLYEAVKGDLTIRAGDPYHFNAAGYEKLADRIADLILGE